MGGRGASSGGPGPLDNLSPEQQQSTKTRDLDTITDTDDPGRRTDYAADFRNVYGSSETTPVKKHDMPTTVDMQYLELGSVTAFYKADGANKDYNNGTAANAFQRLPPEYRRYTTQLVFTDAPAPSDPSAAASGGAGDQTVVFYQNAPVDPLTVIHEAVHNYIAEDPDAGGSMVGTSYDDVFHGAEPSPYPQGGDNVNEDYSESVALYLMDRQSFASQYPQRAAVIELYLSAGFLQGD